MTMTIDVSKLPTDRPLLAIDVDGVLNVLASRKNRRKYDVHHVADPINGYVYTIMFKPGLAKWLDELTNHFVPVWCTMWDDLANAELTEKLGLPYLPVIPCTDTWEHSNTIHGRIVHHKVPRIISHVGDRAVAWIDDEIESGDTMWADERTAAGFPTLAMKIKANEGLQQHNVDKLITWSQAWKAAQDL